MHSINNKSQVIAVELYTYSDLWFKVHFVFYYMSSINRSHLEEPPRGATLRSHSGPLAVCWLFDLWDIVLPHSEWNHMSAVKHDWLTLPALGREWKGARRAPLKKVLGACSPRECCKTALCSSHVFSAIRYFYYKYTLVLYFFFKSSSFEIWDININTK